MVGYLFLKSEKQLLVHSTNCNNIACIRNAVHRHTGTKKGVYKHTESSPRRLKEDEKVVQGLLNCISDFQCFPFDSAAPTPRTLQSAILASDKLIADLKSAYADGEAKLMKFLEERVLTQVKSLFDYVPKNKRLIFANERKKLLHQVKKSDRRYYGEGGTGCNYRNSRKKWTSELKGNITILNYVRILIGF